MMLDLSRKMKRSILIEVIFIFRNKLKVVFYVYRPLFGVQFSNGNIVMFFMMKIARVWKYLMNSEKTTSRLLMEMKWLHEKNPSKRKIVVIKF